MKYQIAIIGGGPGGYVAAIRAAQLGASVALVEKARVGGTCLHWGCIPTKVLAAGAETLAAVKRASEFGVQVDGVTIDFGALMERKNQVVERLAAGVEFLLKKNKVDLVPGTGRLAGLGRVEVTGTEGGVTELEAESIILATGSGPALIASLGYDGRQVITSNEALQLDRVPESLLIIGGGVVGCEFACVFNAMGCKVTIVEMMPTILPTVDQEVARQMQGLLKRQGITLKTKAAITEVRKSPGGVTAVLEGGEEINTEMALISIGRVLNTSGLGLETVALEAGRRAEIPVDSRLATAAPGIYAIGDITGQLQLAHVASAQGLVAVDNILGRSREMDYRVIPASVFTRPNAAGVGITTQEAKEKGLPVKVGKFPLLACGKAQVLGETDGFVKVLAHGETDIILGVHAVGAHAADLVAEAAVAMQQNMTASQLAGVIHAHPTLSEALLEAAEAVHGLSIHM